MINKMVLSFLTHSMVCEFIIHKVVLHGFANYDSQDGFVNFWEWQDGFVISLVHKIVL